MNILSSIPGVEIGLVCAVDAKGFPRIQLEDGSESCASPLWNGVEIDWAACVGQRAAVVRPPQSREGLILLGLLDRPRPPASRAKVVRVEHVRAQDELILECGKSKISLRSDGRITIEGGYLLSRSAGPNKIKGASVDIN